MQCGTREELLRRWHDAVSAYRAVVEQMTTVTGPAHDALKKESQAAHVKCGETRLALDEHEQAHQCSPKP